MPTINNLSSVSSVSAGDQFPLYSPDNGDARKASMSLIMDYVNANLTAAYSTVPQTKTSDFVLGDTEQEIIVNKASSCIATFPAASAWTGRIVWVKTIQAQTVVSASSNVVPLVGGAAGTAILAATAGKWAKLVSDGSNWIITAAA
jgi:hypothetical protein